MSETTQQAIWFYTLVIATATIVLLTAALILKCWFDSSPSKNKYDNEI
jgi:hypothetical protein